MKRWAARCVLLGSALMICVGTADGAQKQSLRMRRSQTAKAQRQDYPPRYVRVPNVQNYVFRDKEGRVQVRKVPSGYAEGFPTPALFYYGYPHSGDDTGLGF